MHDELSHEDDKHAQETALDRFDLVYAVKTPPQSMPELQKNVLALHLVLRCRFGSA